MSYARASDGIRLHYEVIGRSSATPVLMIQGLGADKHGWDMQRLPLAMQYRVIALDNRGAGRSDKPFGTYSLEQMADDAIAVLDEVGVEKAHIVGASMGGAITQIIGLKYPERVMSLTLACTACRNHPWRRELLMEWADLAESRGMREFVLRNLEWMVGPRSLQRLWPAMAVLGPLAFNVPVSSFVAQIQAILGGDDGLRDEFPLGYTQPTDGLMSPQYVISRIGELTGPEGCLLYTSPSPRDSCASRMPSSA